MSKTIVALFNEKKSAESARNDLIRTGISRDGINIEDHTTTALTSRLKSLREVGMPQRHAEAYCEGMRRGGNLLIAKVDDEKNVPKAQEILQKDGAVNLDQRMELWRKDGWTGFDASAKPMSQTEARSDMENYSRHQNDGSFTIPVIEEEIHIGKREVNSGNTIRVHQDVTERPVDETVTLHDERVTVDRKRVNRPVSAADRQAMTDETIEIRERHEEPVIKKQARVTEEITINKEQMERTEHVHDTVKHTDVKIDKADTTDRKNRGR